MIKDCKLFPWFENEKKDVLVSTLHWRIYPGYKANKLKSGIEKFFKKEKI